MERNLRMFLATFLMLFGVNTMFANGDFTVDGFAYIINEDGISVSLTWKDYDQPYTGDVVVPAEVTHDGKTYTVNNIGYLAFSYVTRTVNGSWPVITNNPEVTTVTLPNSITSIDTGGFLKCNKLKNITIPETVLVIEQSAFAGCSSLEEITIPESVYIIESHAFSGCTSLKTVRISDGLGYIGSMAFNGCKNLESVYCYSTKEIKAYKDVFDGCVNATLYGLDDWMAEFGETNGWNQIASKVSLMPITIACGNGGSMLVNGMSFEETIGKAYVSKDVDTTISFTLSKGQQLSMVKLNGEDITNEVVDNVLTTSIPADATLLVTFKNQGYDINQDGEVTVADVVSLVNYILSIE